MDNANEFVRGAFILYPAVTLVLCDRLLTTSVARAALALALGACLWVAQFLTMSAESAAWMLQVYFVAVVVTTVLAYLLGRIRHWLHRTG